VTNARHPDREWRAQIAAAQANTHYLVDGVPFPRIRFGDAGGDEHRESDETCIGCYVRKGQFHVVGCDAERCPRCEGHAVGCLCFADDVAESRTDEQRRIEHRPNTLAELRAEAFRLTALGYRPRDVGAALGINDAAVVALLAGESP
jgi:hypothetical protein